MAHDNTPSSGHPHMDYAEHDKTYAMFLKLAKWGTIGCVAIVVLLGYWTL